MMFGLSYNVVISPFSNPESGVFAVQFSHNVSTRLDNHVSTRLDNHPAARQGDTA